MEKKDSVDRAEHQLLLIHAVIFDQIIFNTHNISVSRGGSICTLLFEAVADYFKSGNKAYVSNVGVELNEILKGSKSLRFVPSFIPHDTDLDTLLNSAWGHFRKLSSSIDNDEATRNSFEMTFVQLLALEIVQTKDVFFAHDLQPSGCTVQYQQTIHSSHASLILSSARFGNPVTDNSISRQFQTSGYCHRGLATSVIVPRCLCKFSQAAESTAKFVSYPSRATSRLYKAVAEQLHQTNFTAQFTRALQFAVLLAFGQNRSSTHVQWPFGTTQIDA